MAKVSETREPAHYLLPRHSGPLAQQSGGGCPARSPKCSHRVSCFKLSQNCPNLPIGLLYKEQVPLQLFIAAGLSSAGELGFEPTPVGRPNRLPASHFQQQSLRPYSLTSRGRMAPCSDDIVSSGATWRHY